jgi:hypothetical protein
VFAQVQWLLLLSGGLGAEQLLESVHWQLIL